MLVEKKKERKKSCQQFWLEKKRDGEFSRQLSFIVYLSSLSFHEPGLAGWYLDIRGPIQQLSIQSNAQLQQRYMLVRNKYYAQIIPRTATFPNIAGCAASYSCAGVCTNCIHIYPQPHHPISRTGCLANK